MPRNSSVLHPLDAWEAQWAWYDEPTYQAVLHHVDSSDVVLDIGAGDLRLSKRLAQHVKHVYAIEKQPALLHHPQPMPDNLTIICADARLIPWPQSATVAVLLMRHCTHIGYYVNKLLSTGCTRLITNARWRLDVEVIDLLTPTKWQEVTGGWYACLCGATGFIPIQPQHLTTTHITHITQVKSCPACAKTAKE